MLESRSALALDREIAQEHAHSGKDHPGGVAPAMPTTRLDEVPQIAGRIRPRIVPKIADEISDIASVRAQSCFNDAPVDFHPLQEPLYQWNGPGSGLDGLDDSALAEMLEESADTRNDLSGAIP
jgi:hypothetical protein